MTYATKQNCIDRYGTDLVVTVTDRDNTGSIDETILGKALLDADNEINSYVAGIPGYPFDPVPDSFEQKACDMAIYFAALPASAATDAMRQRYEDAIKYFSAVASGKIRLPYSAGASFIEPNSTADIVQGERIFTRDTLSELF